MARNAEVIRQWNILTAIDATRLGLTIPDLAVEQHVSTRTIRRDLAALQEVGFPIFDEDRDGRKYWRFDGQALRGLTRSGFTLPEACALYLSRRLLEILVGTPFGPDVVTAFEKIARALPPAICTFLDKLPSVIEVKPTARRSAGPKHRETIARLIEASLQHRYVWMRYYSLSSLREKEYTIEPLKVVYAHGALYLVGYVEEYQQNRTFAVERIAELKVLEQTFVPVHDLTEQVFRDSLGVHSGRPTTVVLVFEPRIAPYIRERKWHDSQQVETRPDGRVVLTLKVCDDWALRTWVLGFGSLVRVKAPASLAEAVLAELEEARQRYVPLMDFLELPRATVDVRAQRLLPFRRSSAVRGQRRGPRRPMRT